MTTDAKKAGPAAQKPQTAAVETSERHGGLDLPAQGDELFRLITDNVTDLIAILDAQGRRLYNSPSYGLLFGKEERRVGGDSFAQIHPDDREYVLRTFRETIATGVGRRTSFRFLRSDGSIRHIESQGNFIRDVTDAEPRVVVVSRDVTERKRAEYQISSLNQRLALAIAGSGYGVWEFELGSHRLHWDEQMLSIYGHTRAAFDGTRAAWQERVLPEDRQRMDTFFSDLLAGRPVRQFEFRILRASDAELRHVESSGYLQLDAEGRTQRVVGMSRDVTAQRQAEQALKASEERHRLLVNHLLAGVVVHAPDTSILFSNAEAGRALGLTTQQMLGKRATDPQWVFFRENGTPMPIEDYPVARVIATGQPFTNDVVGVKHLPGSEITWLIASAYPEFDTRGKLQHVVVSFVDITTGKRAEEALRASEERLQRALDASRISLWDFDLVKGEIYLSETWSELLGGPRIPTTMAFSALAKFVPAEDQAAIATSMISALKGISASYAVEHRVRRTDGKIIWLLSKGRVIERDANGHALRAVGTNQDITERKHSETDRLNLEEQLRQSQKMQAIGTLAGGIAHDFNNILSAILGNVALASQDVGTAQPALLNSLEQIKKSAVRARSLVQQILAFSRHQPHALTCQPLRPMVEETLAMLRATLPAMVVIDACIQDEPIHVLADLTRMQQVLMNLATNAWHALQGSGGRISVGLDQVVFGGEIAQPPSVLPPGRYARLWVSDTGCGMDDATQARIFEPFFTTKPVDQGTGLGLAVVHGIVAAHHGAITVQSKLGQGSRFDVYLPLLAAPAEIAVPVATTPGSGPGLGQRVLYLDDDTFMLTMVERLLQRWGYDVTVYRDARDAVAAVRAQPDAFDLVVTDFNMPELSGLEVAKQLTGIKRDLPTIICSGYVTEELRAQASQIGVRAVVNKETAVDELKGLIYQVLSGQTIAP